jgi:hypothetical protein
VDRQEIFMRGFFDGWLEAMRVACEAQGVIAMRLALMAEGGPQATAEAHQMVAEKLGAFAEGQAAACTRWRRGRAPGLRRNVPMRRSAATSTTTAAASRPRRIDGFRGFGSPRAGRSSPYDPRQSERF